MSITPICSPSSLTKRTSLARISSLMFKRFDGLMGHTPNKKIDPYFT
ncbi:hypothetical protein AO372_1209 [Moraxella catarrhalis]|nr:hypothetical protein AO372_1209 [Moraxella catarrhalis]